MSVDDAMNHLVNRTRNIDTTLTPDVQKAENWRKMIKANPQTVAQYRNK